MSFGLTNYKLTSLKVTNLFYVQSFNFKTRAITLLMLKFWSAFKVQGFICAEMMILAHEMLCFCIFLSMFN